MTKSGHPFLICGKVFNADLPDEFKSHKPITLAKVKLNTKGIKNPCILLNYSANTEIAILHANPIISVVFRLVRKNNQTGEKKVLEDWTLSASEVIPTPATENNTIQPLVLNFCDCLDPHHDESFTYSLQLTDITLHHTALTINKQEFSAIISTGASEA